MWRVRVSLKRGLERPLVKLQPQLHWRAQDSRGHSHKLGLHDRVRISERKETIGEGAVLTAMDTPLYWRHQDCGTTTKDSGRVECGWSESISNVLQMVELDCSSPLEPRS